MEPGNSGPPLRRALPFLNALAVFESAARLNSFTRAAAEIGISQSAVSRHVATLEQHLGVRLFKRTHKLLALTEHGSVLQQGVREGLETVLEAVTQVRAPAAGNRIVIGCSFDNGHLILLPRLYELKQRLGGREVQMFVSDDYREFEAADVDLSIRYGGSSWPRHASQQLAQEVIIAACSPAFARSHGLTGETPVRDLASLPLIQYEATARHAYDWRHWFAQAGVRPRRALRCTMFPRLMFVIDAALQGRGVALVWHFAASRLLADGQLVRVSREAVATSNGFHAVWRKSRDHGDVNRRIARFLSLDANR